MDADQTRMLADRVRFLRDPQPSLTNLENGDLKFRIDFRTVYAAVLEHWLKWPSKDVLGVEWKPADVLAT